MAVWTRVVEEAVPTCGFTFLLYSEGGTDRICMRSDGLHLHDGLPVKQPQVQFLGQEDPLEEGMVNHSSILAWRISWTEEPGQLPFIGFQRVGHD